MQIATVAKSGRRRETARVIMGKRGRGRPPVNPRLLSPFGRRVRALIDASPHVDNRAELCAKVGINESNFYVYEQGRRDPPLELLVSIGKVLHVGLDQLYPTDLPSSDPPYAGWQRFEQTDLGRSMTPEERIDMASVRFRHREPTAELYQLLLLAYRTQALPIEREPTTGTHDLKVLGR